MISYDFWELSILWYLNHITIIPCCYKILGLIKDKSILYERERESTHLLCSVLPVCIPVESIRRELYFIRCDIGRGVCSALSGDSSQESLLQEVDLEVFRFGICGGHPESGSVQPCFLRTAVTVAVAGGGDHLIADLFVLHSHGGFAHCWDVCGWLRGGSWVLRSGGGS